MPYAEAPSFLATSQEIPLSRDATQVRYSDDGSSVEEKKWIMKAVKSSTSGSGSLRRWAKNAWSDFVDLLKVRTIEFISKGSSNGLIECRDSGYRYHDSRLSFHAPDFCLPLPVHEAIGIELLARCNSAFLLYVWLPFWSDCDYQIWRASQHGLAFRRASVLGGDSRV